MRVSFAGKRPSSKKTCLDTNSFRDRVQTFVTSLIRAVAKENSLFTTKAEFMSRVWSKQGISSTSKIT